MPGTHAGLVARLGQERVCAIVVAAVVAAATVVSVAPPAQDVTAPTVASIQLPPSGPVGGPSSYGSGPRLVVGGAFSVDRSATANEQPYEPEATEEFREAVPVGGFASAAPAQAVSGPFLEDGTLLKPVSVNTTVPDAKGMLRTYKVKSGDSLKSVSKRFKVGVSTIWWANKLKSRDLKVGQRLTIPPMNGLVVTVAASDTIEGLAKKHKIEADEILQVNKLEDPNLVIGQVLVLPGAKGKPIPKPPKPKTKASTVSRSVSGPARYTGGRFAWPVAGGYISQYYHYGHYGLDIAADQGTAVKAAAGGKVIFAGWKNNGGGYQVHISHGSGLYTTYNHMSSVTVGTGQSVGRGRQIGRVGMTGWATGPHLHFEVWVGGIWNGGHRVNPLGYL
jgi:murein DD-endopeptidase MepM/ murein hydrolase activator NlpD